MFGPVNSNSSCRTATAARLVGYGAPNREPFHRGGANPADPGSGGAARGRYVERRFQPQVKDSKEFCQLHSANAGAARLSLPRSRQRQVSARHEGIELVTRCAVSGVDIREVALPIMRHLVDHIHLTSHLAILDHEEAVYVERVEAPGFIKINTWVGRRMEVHSTAVGKSLLAYLDAEERETIIRHRGLKKLTPYTITSVTKLMKEFERVRQLGYSVDDEENSLGARCVGAPIFNSQGRVEASLGSTGTITAVPRDAVPRLAEMVKDAARRISHQIGYRGPYPRPS